MSEKEKGEIIGKGHASAVKEAIEDAKRSHVGHPKTGAAITPVVPPPAFQGNGGAIQ